MTAVVGFDTSAYTTSLALADSSRGITGDYRQLLEVKPGQRGLRQSDAVFDHIRHLPHLLTAASAHFSASEIAAVGASITPTPQPDSYMPVFVPGSSWGRSLAASLDVSFYPLSHQEGHIRAGLVDTGIDRAQPFLAVHFSGGTSEIMQVNRQAPGVYTLKVLMRGLDLAAGQLVDRIGVKLGLPFPAGRELERLAMTIEPAGAALPKLPSSVSSRGFSFSGAEAEALRQLGRGTPPPLLAQAVFRCIANTLEKIIRLSSEQHPRLQVLLAGGVMANQLIKARLQQRLDDRQWSLYFAHPQMATDNAVGIALLTLEQHLGEEVY